MAPHVQLRTSSVVLRPRGCTSYFSTVHTPLLQLRLTLMNAVQPTPMMNVRSPVRVILFSLKAVVSMGEVTMWS